MRILYAKTFGIGNAVMAVPAVKALRALGHTVDVLVGETADDVGARQVFESLKERLGIRVIGVDVASQEQKYDLAILAIPYDGRWQKGVHFKADGYLDGRTRPDPSTTGLVSWQKHELEYQLDNVNWISGGAPWGPVDCSFLPNTVEDQELLRNRIYLGVGYKKDQLGFWKVKHWGNENYAQLIRRLLDSDPKLNIIATGDIGDVQHSLAQIIRDVGPTGNRFWVHSTSLQNSFKLVQSCGMYVGNDTGMMHVAASCDRKVVAVFNLENSIVKSRPWCKEYECLDGSKTPVTVDQFFYAIQRMRNGK